MNKRKRDAAVTGVAGRVPGLVVAWAGSGRSAPAAAGGPGAPALARTGPAARALALAAPWPGARAAARLAAPLRLAITRRGRRLLLFLLVGLPLALHRNLFLQFNFSVALYLTHATQMRTMESDSWMQTKGIQFTTLAKTTYVYETVPEVYALL